MNQLKSEPRAKAGEMRSPAWQCGVLIAVFSAMLCLPVLRGGFVHTDWVRIFGIEQDAAEEAADETANPYEDINETGQSGPVQVSPHTGPLRPPLFTYAIRAAAPMFKNNPRPYHAMNLVFHIVCVLLLYLLILAATRHAVRVGPWMWAACAAAGAAVFAAHPGATGGAAWLWVMPQVLAGVFLLASTLLFLQAARNPAPGLIAAYPVSLVLYTLGMFTDTGVLFWFLVPVAVALPLAQNRRTVLVRAVPFVLVSAAAAYLYNTWNVFGGGFNAVSFLARIGAYMQSLVVVWKIPPVHPAPIPGADTWAAIAGAASVAGLTLVMLWGMIRRLHPALSGVAAWLLAATASHALIEQPFLADAGPYLAYAALGLGAAVVGAVAAAPRGYKLSRISAAPMVLAALIVLAALGMATREHMFTFRSDSTFWAHLADDTGREPVVLFQYSRTQMQDGNYAAAATTLAEAFDRAEGQPGFQRTLAQTMLLLALKLYDEKPQHYALSKQFLVKSVNMNPRYPYTYSAMAGIYMDQEQRYLEAYIDMLIARELATDPAPMERGLAMVLQRAAGKGVTIDRAKGRARATKWLRDIGVFKKTDKLQPDPDQEQGQEQDPAPGAREAVPEPAAEQQ